MTYKITLYIRTLIGPSWEDMTLIVCGLERLAEKDHYYFECSRVAASKKGEIFNIPLINDRIYLYMRAESSGTGNMAGNDICYWSKKNSLK